ncbi:MAG: hypothetical protein H8D67_19525 [Deltaproteobacteria bacterium]|nr:hypothetical protein [Deltaproteobacteria bacterium]MBL7174479.1 hypothetical protein [Desulfobacteraceae bacterium]
MKLSPESFRLNDDSPVKKARLNPDRLGGGYVLFDLFAVQRIGGTNRIEIDSVEITTSSLPVHKGSLTVHRDASITKSQARIGDIRVGKGVRMQMRAPRFVLHGNLTCEDGKVEVADTTLVVPQRFNHQRKFSILSSSRLHFKYALLATSFPLAIDIKGGSSMVMSMQPIVPQSAYFRQLSRAALKVTRWQKYSGNSIRKPAPINILLFLLGFLPYNNIGLIIDGLARTDRNNFNDTI